jgi:hypothetical protein
MKIKTLLVFAHPDDEILWMGGFLLKYGKFLKIDFICITAPFNISRIAGLLKLDLYFDTGKIVCLGYPDDPAVYREGAPFQFDDSWVDALDFDKYDLIFSHNENGEYGHPHHKYAHDTLKKYSAPFISFGQEECFDFSIRLEPELIKKKQGILKELYQGEVCRCLPHHPYWSTDQEGFKFEGPKERFPAIKKLLKM